MHTRKKIIIRILFNILAILMIFLTFLYVYRVGYYWGKIDMFHELTDLVTIRHVEEQF